MRINLTGIVLLFFCMQSALATLAQKISLSHTSVPIEEVFKDIRQQSGYDFTYPKPIIKQAKLVSIHVDDAALEVVLNELFKHQPFTFSLENKTIIVKAREKTLSEKISDYFQADIQVDGRVIGADDQPLAGANIQVSGSNVLFQTDEKGYFVIGDVPENATLVISYVGYETKRIQVGDESINLGSIKLTLQLSKLSDVEVVVNTGYQSISRERVTGSYGIVSGAELEEKLSTDLKSALEGKIPGLVLDKNGNIEIRGVSTFNAERDPLVVVDGYPVEGGIDNINPLNISNITVLKDGVAASIYGSRAANGVIVVTTKTGKKGPPTVTYDGFVNVVSKPDLSGLNRASTSDYIDAELDLYRQNPNGPSTISRSNMSRVTYLMMQVREGNMSEAEAMAEIDQLRNIDGLQQIEDHLFRPEISNQHNLSLSGGSDQYTYHAAVNLLNTRENFVHSNRDRFVLDVKNEWRPNDFLTVGATVNLTYGNGERPYSNQAAIVNYGWNTILQPYTALVDENGNPASVWGISQYKVDTYENAPGMKDWSYVPIHDMSLSTRRTQDVQSRINGFLRADIAHGLTAEFGGSWQKGYSQVKELRDVNSYEVRIAYNDATSLSNPANHYLPDGSIIDEARNLSESWTIRTQLNYNRDFDQQKHRVNALVGNEVRKLTFDHNRLQTRVGYNAVAGSFVPMNLKDYNAGIYNSDMLMGRQISLEPGEYAYQDNRFVSWYGNASYEYDSRFIVSGSIRLDLTNFFGTDPDYRYRPLWSIGGTYKLKEEKFFKVDWINRLNLRTSYGINGNISLSQGPFLILSTGAYENATGGVSYGVASPPNDQLRWERTSIVNVGLDFSAWNYRLNASIDYYTKNSTDLLAAEVADPTTGFANITKNAGEMSNSGIELSMDVNVIKNRYFSWHVAPNIAYNYNNVKTYNVVRNYASHYTVPDVLVAGYPADGLWGYRFAGLSNVGETQVYNVEGAVIAPGNADPDDVLYLGTTRPKWDLSLANRFSYKKWTLSAMLISKLGHSFRKDHFNGNNYRNRHVADRWQQAGDEAHTIYPPLRSFSMDLFYFPYIDALVANAGYMKLRDLTLSYNFGAFAEKVHMKNARVFIQGRNLFTLTAKGVDIDPETVTEDSYTAASFASLPHPAEFFVGVSFSF